MVSFRITKNGFIGSGTGSLQGTATHAITASSVAWNDVTGKPSAYPAADHDHTGDHLKPTSVTTTGDITVGGNLIVNGSQTVIKTKNLTVKDKLIEIASGSTTQTAADGAGIAIQTASAATQEGGEAASARIQYRSSDNHFTASIGFVAPSFTGSLQGTATSASFALDHYVPTQSVGKTVNAGQVISGLGLDAKGHVVTVTGSNTIASASRAVSAKSAEKLSTSNVGGTGEPVYFENGVPVADEKTKGVVDWVTINSGSLSTPNEVIWKKGTGIDSIVQVLTGVYEAKTPTATGAGAVAVGSKTNASGRSSHAEGHGTIASGDDSHAEGLFTTSSGDDSHAEGQGTNASGISSHTEGYFTEASGPASHAEGMGTIAYNDAEHAQGIANHNSTNQIFSVGAGEVKDYTVVTRRNAVSVLVVPNSDTKINTASFFVQNVGGYNGTNPIPGTNDLATVINGVSSIWKKGEGTDSAVRVLTGDLKTLTPLATGIGTVAVGLATVASGTGSHAEGMMVAASGICSHAEGQTTEASGFASHAEGFYTTASGDYSHAEGSGSIASGQYSHAEGLRTTASGVYSHVEGYGTDAGDYSHAEGTSTKASGTSNHAEGLSTEALGYASHAEGCSTTASGDYSHAEGFGTTTSNIHEHAQGMYNHTSSNQIFSIGTGESNDSRRNAVSVLAVKSKNNKYTASVFVQNIGGYNGTNPIPGTNDLATVINGITSNAGTVTSVDVSVGTGITASVTNATTTPTISISSAQAHTHSNKAELDRIASGDVAKWNAKQNAIDDLDTIRSKANNGQTAYDWGDHRSAGYAKSGDITTAINNLVAASESKWSTDTDTKVTAVGNHYTPAQSTAKTASAGSVISGIGLDAAGHVTSITSSNSISNATNATIATNLGVVGNTSESVAKAIAEKWTYNEDTIKGVVVNKAVSATKLVGTSGSEGVPVYIEAGVPKACQANLVSLPLSSTGATSGTVTLAPGKVHNCGTLTGNLTINLDASSTDSHEAIYCCVFNMGPTLQTIELPKDVKVVENSADLDTTNMYYEINIMNKVAIIARTSAS